MPEKTCSKCNERKPLTEFDQIWRVNGELKGRSTRCTKCRGAKRTRQPFPPQDGLKKCSRCRDTLPASAFSKVSTTGRLTSACKSCVRTYYRAWNKRPGPPTQKRQETIRRSQLQCRVDVLMHYSNGTMKCACCGEAGLPFLSLDHINGNGNQHRKSLMGNKNKAGTEFFYKLRQEGFPSGLQVLCFNCNMAKRQRPQCPHATQNTALKVSHG
jgi:hypothetical protein